ncbi:MAG: STT3 domain-containing protein [bacterium]
MGNYVAQRGALSFEPLRPFAPVLIPVALVIVLILGFFLRMIPYYVNSSRVDFRFDRAFHFRMTQEVVDRGCVPEVDTLSVYPEGKRVNEYVPTALYLSAGAFHRIVNLFHPVPLKRSILYFTSLIGCLIALPVFFLSKELFGSTVGALFSAFLSVIIPAHVHRTACYWFRYDGLGVLLLICATLFLIKGARSRDRSHLIAYSILSALFFGLATYAWRVCLGYFMIVCSFTLLLLLAGRMSRAWGVAFLIVGVTHICSLLLIPYLSAANYILSKYSLFVGGTAICVALFLAFSPQRNPALRSRFLIIGAVFALLLVGTWKIVPASEYGGAVTAFSKKMLKTIGINIDYVGFERLYIRNKELMYTSLGDLFDKDFFSLSSLLLPLAILFEPILRKRVYRKQSRDPGHYFAYSLALLFFVLTMFIQRTKTLLSPFLALLGGQSVLAVAAMQTSPGKRLRPAPFQRQIYYGTILLLATITLKTGYDSYSLMRTRPTRFRPAERAYISWIKKNTAPNDVILTYWSAGYFIQTYAHRKTLTDGLFEHPTVQSRILEVAKAYYSRSEGPLYAYCKRNGVAYIILPTDHKSDIAYAAGLNYWDYFRKNKPTERGKRTTIGRMIYATDEVEKFELQKSHKGFLIYRVP